MARFDGKVALITGGAQGMGAAHCRGFHAEGASVVVADVLADGAQRLAGELGDRAIAVELDVTDLAAWKAAVAVTEERFGPIDVFVNNAGIIEKGGMTLEDADPSVMRRIIDVNLFGGFLGIKAVVPSMRRAGGGAIVLVGSIAAFTGSPCHAAYVASKWAIRGLTRSAALELGRDGIRVNAIHPGITDTPMHAMNQSAIGGVPQPELYKQFAIPRIADPDEVTRMVLFVASSDASFSSGADFMVDGGFLTGVALPSR